MIEHTIRKHARLSASRMDRVMSCPGSYRLESLIPEQPSGPAAARGTAIHELSEKILRGEEIDDKDIDPDYIEMAKKYANFVEGYFENPRKRMIEVNLDDGLKSIHKALGGTADAILVEGDTMACIDLKTGRVAVDAEDNMQLMTYALGAMLKLNAPDSINVDLVIFQPGVGVSVHKTTGEKLKQHGKELLKAAELALTDDAPTVPSPGACKYCRAKPACPSLRHKVIESAKKDFSIKPVPPAVEGADFIETPEAPPVSPDDIINAQLAVAWGESVLDAAKQQITAGREIQGWVMRPGRKTKFWKSEALAEEALRFYPAAFEVKSPAAIAKLGIEIAETLIGEKHAAPSLVKEKSKE